MDKTSRVPDLPDAMPNLLPLQRLSPATIGAAHLAMEPIRPDLPSPIS
jgi:hypothetical protein